MNIFLKSDLILLMALILFGLGAFTVFAGILILVLRPFGKDVRMLASQTSRLAQKGLAEEVAGLVGNASTLLEALNQLTRTSTGVGVFLTVIGVSMMAAGCGLAVWMLQNIP